MTWRARPFRLRGFLFVALAAVTVPPCSCAQTPQQYIYGSTPLTPFTSDVLAYAKNGSTGALSPTSGSPVADNAQGGALAIDSQGHFLFIVNPTASNISMFQIDPSSGNLTEVPGSPFAPVQTVSAATSPVCLATEPSGHFLYVGYRVGNTGGGGAVNAFQIDSTNRQIVPLAVQAVTGIPSSPVGMFTDPKGLHLYVGLGVNVSTGLQDAGTQVYSIDTTTGELSFAGFAGNSTTSRSGRSIAMDPKGRFFFDGWGGNGDPGVIDSAPISPADGTAITGISTITLAAGLVPTAMLAEGSGNFLYVMQNATPAVYSINQTTGALTQTPALTGTLAFSSISAVADPLGPYLYSLQSNGLHGFQIDSQSGSLSEIPGSPFAAGSAAQGTLAISGAPSQAVSGPVAALFPALEDFGGVNVGQTSGSHMVTLTNTGSQALTVNSVGVTGADPQDFAATPTCSLPTVIAANASCTISVTFSPTAVGARQANLTATDNAPGSPQSISLSGTGVAPQPAVTISPASLTFASTAEGSTRAAQTISVSNTGNATLHITSAMLSGADPSDFAIANGCSGAYAVNVSCTISVTFSPIATGQRLASIVITDDGPNSPQSVPLTGTGATPPSNTPAVTLAPTSVTFGAVTQGTSAAAQSITLTSSGTSTLHISSIVLGGSNPADVTVSNGCAAGAFAVTATCSIGVGFAPVALGARSATITITDDALNSPQVINLSAVVNPALTIAPVSSRGTSVTISAGQTAGFNLQLTPGAGFAGNVAFACSGVPAGASCSAPSAPLTSGTVVNYTVSVATTGSGTIVSDFWHWCARPMATTTAISLVMAALVSMILLACGRSRLSSRPGLVWVAVMACVIGSVVASAGCGGGTVTSASAELPQSLQGTVTPQGTSTITLVPTPTTASGKQLPSLQPIQLTLIVN